MTRAIAVVAANAILAGAVLVLIPVGCTSTQAGGVAPRPVTGKVMVCIVKSDDDPYTLDCELAHLDVGGLSELNRADFATAAR